jgi:Fe2+ or Zn2+ uptake regulation protein
MATQLKATSQRVSALRKRIMRVLEKNPGELHWRNDLYFQFRKANNIHILFKALESVGHSGLVKVSYFRRGKQVMYGIPAFQHKRKTVNK